MPSAVYLIIMQRFETNSQKMKKILIAAGFLISGILTAPAQTAVVPKLVETVKKSPDGMNIPYSKYVYPNGLTLLVHEDHSDPVVYVDVTYHVGSARELAGRSGFAHFFEHMMFQGSDHVADEEHFKIVTEAGGTLNGTTNTDRTNYFETLPSNQLEVALWLESDRMGYFLDAVTQEKFEVQRATVKNERGQNYDNRPYGLVREKIGEVLYPFNHPYSWTTIGYIDDLNAANLDDLKRFFLRWYGPNNATLTIAGDVNTEEVTKLVAKYFGTIPRGPEVTNMKPVPAVLTEDKYISYEDNIKFPMLKMVFPGVESRHPDEAALDYLAEALGGGKNSILYQQFVKSQTALQANAMNPTAELAGNMEITIVAYPDKKLSAMEKMVRDVLNQFEQKGISEEELERYKAAREADLINSLKSVQGKGALLASNQTFTGNPDYLKEEVKRYANVTTKDVMRVYEKYIKGKKAVILSVYPKGKSDNVAAADNAKRPAWPEGFKNNLSEYESLKYNKAPQGFDRSKKPAPGKNPVINVPQFWNTTLANGIQIIGSGYDEVPTTDIQISIPAGQFMETTDKNGVAQLTAALLNESTNKRSAEEISAALEMLGSSIRINADKEEMNITVSALNKNLDKTLLILEEILFQPKFSAEEFNRLKTEQLQSIKNQQTNANAIAGNIFRKVMYPAGSIQSLPESGTDATVNTLTVEDVKKFYDTWFAPDFAKIVIVGNINKTELESKLGFLNKWNKKGVKLPAFVSAKGPEKTTIYFANKDNAPQSQLLIGEAGLRYNGLGDYYQCGIMNYVLGGAFNSRINLNLREKHGYTYGARMGFNGSDYVNLYSGGAGVKAEATDSSIIEFMKELKNYVQSGITASELEFTKNSIGQRDALKFETPGQKAGFIKNIMENKYDKELITKQNNILKKMTVAEINELAKKYVHPEKMAIVVVGDRKRVFDKLKALGYDIVEMDAYGNPLK